MDRQHEAGRSLRRLVLSLSLIPLLSGCLTGEEVIEEADASNEFTLEVSGSVGDGPIVGASMRVLANNGSVLSVFESSSAADYVVSVVATADQFPLKVEALDGIDLVTNLEPDFSLYGIVLAPLPNVVSNVNPFTTLAIETASALPGGATENNVLSAAAIVASELNFGLQTLVDSASISTPIVSANAAEIVRASEALGELVRRTRNWLATTGASATGDQIVRAIAADLIDGKLDGLGASGANPRIAAIASIVAAQIALETLANELHVNDVDASAELADAIRLVAGSGAQSLSDLTATAELIHQARIGVQAAFNATQSAGLESLLDSTAGFSAGLSSDLARGLLPTDYRQTLDGALVVVSGGGDEVIETVNSTVRSGDVNPNVNEAPTISGTPPATVVAGSEYSFQPSAFDADGDPLSFFVSGLPGWLSLDTETGLISGVPSSSEVGDWPGIRLSVSDGLLTSELAVFSISVVATPPPNRAPVISGTPPGGATVGLQYSFRPEASDPDGDALTFSAVNLPSWMQQNASNGRIFGTPTDSDVGVYDGISILVDDGQLGGELGPFTITVAPAPVQNSAPTIGGNPPSYVEAGTSYSFRPTASDPEGDTLTFSAINLPSWMQQNASNGRIFGTPTDSDVGTYGGISIIVDDGELSDELGPFTISVDPGQAQNSPPTIGGTPSQTAQVGSAYSFVPSAQDSDGDNLVFSVENLPIWASFDPDTGSIGGVPGAGDVNTYGGIVITVSDGAASASLPSFEIVVFDVATGSATLAWDAPTQNTDGSPLTDLAGFKVYWGQNGSYDFSATIDNSGVTTYLVENLGPGTWNFVTTAYNSSGVESEFSNVASKTIE